jgi:hypothetical protein
MKSEQAPCIVEWVLVNAALDRIYLVQLSATKLVNKRLVPPQGWFTVRGTATISHNLEGIIRFVWVTKRD